MSLKSDVIRLERPWVQERFGIYMIAEFYKTQENMILAPLVNLGNTIFIICLYILVTAGTGMSRLWW